VTRRRAPRQAGEAFRVARDMAAPKTGLASVQAGWSGAVGAQIAEVAEPISERAGTLTVECTNAMWAQELDLMQSQLLERLREALGEGAPEAIKFRVARGS
jgi:predicted nucleic acid-binding Zn ribbon protein